VFKLAFWGRDILKNFKEINEFFNSLKIIDLEIFDFEIKNEENKITQDYNILKNTLRSLNIKNLNLIKLELF
jgi:hypothetical protein